MKKIIFPIWLICLTLASCSKEPLVENLTTKVTNSDYITMQRDLTFYSSSCNLKTTQVASGFEFVDLLNCHADNGGFTDNDYIFCLSPLETVYLSGEGAENAIFEWSSNQTLNWNSLSLRSQITSTMYSIILNYCPDAVIVDIEFFVNFCPCGQNETFYYIGFNASVCCNPSTELIFNPGGPTLILP